MSSMVAQVLLWVLSCAGSNVRTGMVHSEGVTIFKVHTVVNNTT